MGDMSADTSADISANVSADISVDISADMSEDISADISADVSADTSADVSADISPHTTAYNLWCTQGATLKCHRAISWVIAGTDILIICCLLQELDCHFAGALAFEELVSIHSYRTILIRQNQASEERS